MDGCVGAGEAADVMETRNIHMKHAHACISCDIDVFWGDQGFQGDQGFMGHHDDTIMGHHDDTHLWVIMMSQSWLIMMTHTYGSS